MTEYILYGLFFLLGYIVCFGVFMFFMKHGDQNQEALIHSRHLRDEHAQDYELIADEEDLTK